MAQRGESRLDVSAPAGRVTGIDRDGIALFRGIRFAEAPVGDLRFAAPVDAAPADTIDATAWGAVSLQDIDPLPRRLPGTENYFYAPGITTSEDCLNLNIWAPLDTGSEPAPVLFWIYGGGFLCGSGTGPWVDGSRYARDHGVIVVSVNYRLGLLGNLWLGDLQPGGSDLAIQDQISALRWVQRNIAAFGGDPKRVTIMGQSAGGMSVAALLTAPDARGLFHGAAIISGHLAGARTVDQALETRRRVLEELAVDPDGDILTQLRGLSTLRILQIQRELGIGVRAFPLVTDDVVLPADPLGAIRDGEAAQVPLLLGVDSEEDRLFTLTGWSDEPGDSASLLRTLLADASAETIAEAEALYSGVGRDDIDRQYLISNDQSWAAPSQALADAHSAAGNPTFQYEFSRRSTALEGAVDAAHLAELPFFWNNLDAPGVTELLGDDVLTDPALARLAERVSGTIARFVTTGNADGGPLGDWPATSPEARTTMVIDVEPHAERDRNAERIAFWRNHDSAPALSTVTGSAS
ncbi:MAG: carboxylesterase family protein [Actinomycetota bacterium]